MYSNRYRDIIDAADGIHVMKSCAKQVGFAFEFNLANSILHIFNQNCAI